MTSRSAYTNAAGSGRVWWLGSWVEVKLTAAETDGRLGMWVWEARRGAAAPLHVHRREDEQFLVVEGEVRFVLGTEQIEARAGDLVVLPRDVPHAYVITSETARVVGTVTPGGFEAMFTLAGTPALPGETDGPPPAPEALARASEAVGVELLGPPPPLDT